MHGSKLGNRLTRLTVLGNFSATRARIESTYALKALPSVHVKGRTAEVEVFSLE